MTKSFADHLRSTATANTAPPAGFEATCPKCGGPSNLTIIKARGECVACLSANFAASSK